MSAPSSRKTGTARRTSPAARAATILVLGLTLSAGAVAAQSRGWRLPGLDGGELTEGDVANGMTIMMVWAGWSPRCRGIVERVNAVVDRWGDGARVVTVDFQEEEDEVREFVRGKSLRAPVYLDRDGTFSKRHRVTTLPGLVVYRDGEVVHQCQLPRDVDAVISSVLGD